MLRAQDKTAAMWKSDGEAFLFARERMRRGEEVVLIIVTASARDDMRVGTIAAISETGDVSCKCRSLRTWVGSVQPEIRSVIEDGLPLHLKSNHDGIYLMRVG